MADNKISNLWKKEDWLAVWIGFIIIAIGCVAVLTGWFKFDAAKFKTWHCGEDLKEAQIYNNVKLSVVTNTDNNTTNYYPLSRELAANEVSTDTIIAFKTKFDKVLKDGNEKYEKVVTVPEGGVIQNVLIAIVGHVAGTVMVDGMEKDVMLGQKYPWLTTSMVRGMIGMASVNETPMVRIR